jgi:hypothetical protein
MSSSERFAPEAIVKFMGAQMALFSLRPVFEVALRPHLEKALGHPPTRANWNYFWVEQLARSLVTVYAGLLSELHWGLGDPQATHEFVWPQEEGADN